MVHAYWCSINEIILGQLIFKLSALPEVLGLGSGCDSCIMGGPGIFYPQC